MDDIIQDLNKQARLLLVPKNYFSWQTLILLSLFSLVIAAALEAIAGTEFWAIRLLTNLSWIFFIAAVWWALSEAKKLKVYGFPIAPWITGILLCLFFFHPWRNEERLRWAIASWPIISTGVKALPHFINWELEVKLPNDKVKKTLITTLLVNLLLSCWIVFHFRIQDWIQRYPSLLHRGFGESEFVYDFVANRQQASQGGLLLETMATEISAELTDQPWYQTERWLYTRRERLEAIFRQSLRALEAPGEDEFWRLTVPEPRPLGEGYRLDLQANWAGPVAFEGDFYLEKSCKILPVDRPRDVDREEDEPPPTTQSTVVDCDEESPVEKQVSAP